ncbi:hypothetical protein VTP01DRAFT_7826 [Rhizomucor pusillus]|uniref:uncharacterized protein n=1 Tax=Rhizomucor pusillus TaxID=4840 RepID=UPI0037429B2F
MASSLSMDIIYLITCELPQPDRYNALCISRAWYPACHQALYHRVEISSRNQLKNFLAAVSATAYSPYPVGNLFRYVRLAETVTIHQAEFDDLPSLLPNLGYLDIAWRAWRRIKLRKHMRGYATFQKIYVTHCPMELERLDYLDGKQIQGLRIDARFPRKFPWKPYTIFQMLPRHKLSHLRTLEFDTFMRKTLILQDFAALQQSLPMLTDLRIMLPVTIFIDWKHFL